MAANRAQYNDLAMDARSTNSITVRHWFAKLHTDKATHLARFYLDEIIVNVDGSGVKGYLGVCNVGSFNYNMHAAARRGCIGSGAAGGNGLAFQDGGLNTLGICQYDDSPMVAYANHIIIPSTFKSAYYVASSNYGYRAKKSGGSWITINNTTIAEATTLTTDLTVRIFGNPFSEGELIEFQPFITNAEGTFYGTSVRATVGKNINYYDANFRDTTPCTAGTDVDVIMDESVREWLKTFSDTGDGATGRYIYKSISSSGTLNPADEGYYQGLIVALQDRIVWVDSYGEIRKIFNCVSPPTEVLIVNINREFTMPGDPEEFTVGLTVNHASFSSDITVSGTLEEYNGATLVSSFSYSVTVLSGTLSASSSSFNKLSSGNLFVFNSATASPDPVDSTATNPVKKINE